MPYTRCRAASRSMSPPFSFAASTYHLLRQLRQKPARIIRSMFCTSLRSSKCRSSLRNTAASSSVLARSSIPAVPPSCSGRRFAPSARADCVGVDVGENLGPEPIRPRSAGAPHELVTQPARLLRRECSAPIADDTLAHELGHPRRTCARPAALIAAHASEANLLPDRGDHRGVARGTRRRLADELGHLRNHTLDVLLHPLVGDEEHVRRAPLRVPGREMIEVVAEIHLAEDEALEEIVERAVREVVVVNEAARVMVKRHRAVERVA